MFSEISIIRLASDTTFSHEKKNIYSLNPSVSLNVKTITFVVLCKHVCANTVNVLFKHTFPCNLGMCSGVGISMRINSYVGLPA